MRRREFLVRLGGAVWTVNAALRSHRVSAAPQALPTAAGTDAYARYVHTSKDFQRVKQDKGWCEKAFPGWLYMPWTYQWTIGYTDDFGKMEPRARLQRRIFGRQRRSAGLAAGQAGLDQQVRPALLSSITPPASMICISGTADSRSRTSQNCTAAAFAWCRSMPRWGRSCAARSLNNVSQVQSSPFRAAYALDDEVSWGHFVHPTMWRITDDPHCISNAWLKEVYGPGAAPTRDHWVTYEDIRPHLATPGPCANSMRAPLMDQWSFNDSYWCNFLGDLVEYANSVDPDDPLRHRRRAGTERLRRL